MRKNKWLLIIAVFAVLAMLGVMLASCSLLDSVKDMIEEHADNEDGNEEEGGKEEENGNSGTGDTINVAEDYDSTEIAQKMDQLREQGIFISIVVSAAGEDGAAEYSYGAKGDVYYYNLGSEEVYCDLSHADGVDLYTSRLDDDGNVVWGKQTIPYSAGYNAETAKSSFNAMGSIVWGYFGSYSNVLGGEGKKTSTSFLGRECDRYVYSESAVTVTAAGNVKAEYIVDKETGICMMYDATINYAGGDGSGTLAVRYECVRFDTDYTPVLPTVTEAAGQDDYADEYVDDDKGDYAEDNDEE